MKQEIGPSKKLSKDRKARHDMVLNNGFPKIEETKPHKILTLSRLYNIF
jgi:hypothetical protein